MKEADKKNLKLLIRHLGTNIATEDLIEFVARTRGMLDACRNIVSSFNDGTALSAWFQKECQRQGIKPENIILHVERVLQIFSPPMENDNNYSVLGLEPGASVDEIKHAFRRLSVKYHPDMAQGDKEEASERFIKICQAYKRLTLQSDKDSKPAKGNDPASPWIYKKKKEAARTSKFSHFTPLAVLASILLVAALVAPMFYKHHILFSHFGAKTPEKPQKRIEASSEPREKTGPGEHQLKLASAEMQEREPAVHPVANETIPENTKPVTTEPAEDLQKEPHQVPEAAQVAQEKSPGQEKHEEPLPGKEIVVARVLHDTLPAGKIPPLSEPAEKKKPARKEAPAKPEAQRGKKAARQTSSSEVRKKTRTAAVTRPEKATKKTEKRHPERRRPKTHDNSKILSAQKHDPASFTSASKASPHIKPRPSGPGKDSTGKNEEMARTLSAELMHARISYFVKRYCRTYEKRDFNQFATLFASNAVENGESFASLRSDYEKLFKKVSIINLNIVPYKWKTKDDMVRLDGHFNVFLQYQNGRKRNLSGRISMLLNDIQDRFKVKELTYSFEK